MPKKKYDVEKVLEDRRALIARVRKADAAARKKKKEKIGWIEKLKMGVTGELAKKRHSKAGRKYLRSK